LTVTLLRAAAPVVGVTVNVYVNVPVVEGIDTKLTVALPPLEITVAASVPLHAGVGAQESAAVLVALPPNAAKTLVLPPALMIAVSVDVACVAPTLKASTCALTLAVTAWVIDLPSGVVTVSVYTVLPWML